MYPMREFQEEDRNEILSFLRKYPLGLLAAVGDDGKIVATHVPLLIDAHVDELTLRGHIMRKTEHWHGFQTAREVLAVFTGPDAPVSESWLEGRPFGGTWNYMAVHARGPLRFVPEEGLVEILRELKNLNEADTSTKFENLPPEYVSSLIGAIDGFEIQVSSVQAVFKLSQNRTVEDFGRVATALKAKGGESALVAEEMLARQDRFFAEG